MPYIGRARFLRRQPEESRKMPKYNSNFELSVADMDLIESALRKTKADLSVQLDRTSDGLDDKDETLRQIHDLLGRLHNQKVFYRPRHGAYIGG